MEMLRDGGQVHIDELAAMRGQVAGALVFVPAFVAGVVIAWGAPAAGGSFLFALAICSLAAAALGYLVGALVTGFEWLRLHFLAAFLGRGVVR